MVEESSCGPWSDRKCVNKDSGTKATRENPATAEPVTANLNTTASLHPSSDYKVLIAWVTVPVALIVGVVVVVVWKRREIVAYVKTIRPSKCWLGVGMQGTLPPILLCSHTQKCPPLRPKALYPPSLAVFSLW